MFAARRLAAATALTSHTMLSPSHAQVGACAHHGGPAQPSPALTCTEWSCRHMCALFTQLPLWHRCAASTTSGVTATCASARCTSRPRAKVMTVGRCLFTFSPVRVRFICHLFFGASSLLPVFFCVYAPPTAE